MGMTKKPCPGCGKVERSRPADGVCSACRKILVDYDRLRSELTKNRVVARCPDSQRAHDYKPFLEGHGGSGRTEAAHYLRIIFVGLINAVGRGLDRTASHHTSLNEAPKVTDKTPNDYTMNRAFDSGVPEALNDLDRAIREALREANENGLNRGRSALLQLASGECTLDDFTRRTGEGVG